MTRGGRWRWGRRRGQEVTAVWVKAVTGGWSLFWLVQQVVVKPDSCWKGRRQRRSFSLVLVRGLNDDNMSKVRQRLWGGTANNRTPIHLYGHWNHTEFLTYKHRWLFTFEIKKVYEKYFRAKKNSVDTINITYSLWWRSYKYLYLTKTLQNGLKKSHWYKSHVTRFQPGLNHNKNCQRHDLSQ